MSQENVEIVRDGLRRFAAKDFDAVITAYRGLAAPGCGGSGSVPL
jgi:hypothetical protein